VNATTKLGPPPVAITRREPATPPTDDQLIDELRKHRDEADRLHKLAAQLRANQINIESELRCERAIRLELREQVAQLRAERDEARRELVAAMQTIEAATVPAPEEFAVWLCGRGWLAGDYRAHVGVSERLSGAMRFATEGEARAALELAAAGEPVAHLSDVGSVVTL
jgi:DNA gyrase/topoisomerase IV subunit A